MADPGSYRRHGLVSADDVKLASADFDLLDTLDTSFGSDAGSEGNFPWLEGATAWLNSAPLTPAGLRGKVVAVDFWTYTCINCNWLRTLPYLRARSSRRCGPRRGER
jgi:thiol-disulfide isomerase/thioredoxin